MDADLVIIGGGPVGSTLGLLLAGAGVDLAAEGFPPVAGVRYRLEGGASVRGDLRSGLGRGVRRTRFDALLAERASAAPGVQFLCGCAALAVHAEAGGMRVETDHGRLRAGAVIAADGL